MDKLTQYRQIVQEILKEYGETQPAYGNFGMWKCDSEALRRNRCISKLLTLNLSIDLKPKPLTLVKKVNEYH